MLSNTDKYGTAERVPGISHNAILRVDTIDFEVLQRLSEPTHALIRCCKWANYNTEFLNVVYQQY